MNSILALNYLQTVSDSENFALSIGDQVLPEEHVVTESAILSQRSQWLLPRALARLLVYRRDHTPLAWLDDVEEGRADANLAPPVFIISERARDNEVRAKAIHRQIIFKA